MYYLVSTLCVMCKIKVYFLKKKETKKNELNPRQIRCKISTENQLKWNVISDYYIYTKREREKKTTDIYLSLNEYISSTNKGIHTHILNKLPLKRTKKCKNSRQYEISRKHQATNSI